MCLRHLWLDCGDEAQSKDRIEGSLRLAAEVVRLTPTARHAKLPEHEEPS